MPGSRFHDVHRPASTSTAVSRRAKTPRIRPNRREAREPIPWLLLTGILLVALTMRAPIIAIAPSLSEVRTGLDIGPGTAGLFTTIPVLCFGLGTPLVLSLVRRSGIENAVLIGLAGTLVGGIVRSTGPISVALLGTLLMGLSITIGNVVIPVFIGRDFPTATTLVTASYSSALNVGAMLASTLSAPLTALVGWRFSLAAWGLFAVLAATVWRVAVRRPGAQETGGPLEAGVPPEAEVVPAQMLPPLWRRPLVVGMIVAFAGQSFSYYGVSAWLPTLLHDDLGLSAGAAGASSSIFQVIALLGAFAVPGMLARGLSARFALLAVCTSWICLPLGLALAPSGWPLWCFFGGAAQGGGFTVIFSVVVARAVSVHDSRRMSAAVQGFGYCLGATGPFAVGFIHSIAGGWVTPMLFVAAVIALMAVAGSIAIGSRPTTHTSHARPASRPHPR
jgi:CP family cyanate transporter-like MFS transporter